eukprot:1366221-Amorphochlora_amoeboformis.AAC.1
MDPTPTPDRQLWIQKPANKKARWTQIKPIGAAGGNTPPPPVSFVNQHRSPNGKEGYQIFAQMVAKPSQEYNKSVRVGFQGGVGQTPARQDQGFKIRIVDGALSSQIRAGPQPALTIRPTWTLAAASDTTFSK